MPIIGLNLNSINARIYPEKKTGESINVNSSPSIEKVEKRDVGVSNLKDVLAIKFKFETKYEPKIGEINIEGDILYSSEKHKNILERWEKEKKLDDSIAIEVMNTIFRRCLTEAINLSTDLRLPPPIRFPMVKPKDDNEYTG